MSKSITKEIYNLKFFKDVFTTKGKFTLTDIAWFLPRLLNFTVLILLSPCIIIADITLSLVKDYKDSKFGKPIRPRCVVYKKPSPNDLFSALIPSFYLPISNEGSIDKATEYYLNDIQYYLLEGIDPRETVKEKNGLSPITFLERKMEEARLKGNEVIYEGVTGDQLIERFYNPAYSLLLDTAQKYTHFDEIANRLNKKYLDSQSIKQSEENIDNKKFEAFNRLTEKLEKRTPSEMQKKIEEIRRDQLYL